MTLFCDGSVILPEHVVFAPDLEPETPGASPQKTIAAPPADNNNHALITDLSLGRAVERHISFVYKQTQQNQRKTAKLLGISRAKLVRHLREMVQERDQ
jgi:DNA-binding NtrC family response regulator